MKRGEGAHATVELRDAVKPLFDRIPRLEKVHWGFSLAADAVEIGRGAPICVENCGLCCETTPIVYGIEAEYLASWLLSKPDLFKDIMNRCRDWLTSRNRPWTYKARISENELNTTLANEYRDVLNERCPFLADDKRCMVHFARPMACRAYGTTHMPNDWCKRPIGVGEQKNGDKVVSRVWFDPDHPMVPIKKLTDKVLEPPLDSRYKRQGFLPTLLFERFYASELAGMLDDGKVPAAKVVQRTGGPAMLLWQDQLDKEWSNRAADASIDTQVPLEEDRKGRIKMKTITAKGKR